MSNRILDQVMATNQEFVKEFNERNRTLDIQPPSKIPSKELAIFTCMDTRLVDLLEQATGVGRGQAKMIKNAGNTLANPFGVVVRSLVMAIFELGVKEIMVIGHRDCGMSNATADGLIEKMIDRGISSEAIKVIDQFIDSWVDSFHHPVQNVENVVKQLRTNPFIPKDIPIHGLIIDPNDGRLDLLVNGYDQLEQK